jgi:cytoskeletal protein CcmA (bactofilin family)
MFGREINHTGRVGGAYRAFGQIINVTGYVGRSALLLGSDISVGSGAVIERDLTMFGSDITVEGAVKGNLKAEANRIELSGVIAGDVTLDANEINIIKPAVILGKLTYTSKNQAVIDSANGVTVAGGTTWKLPSEEDEKKDEESNKYTSMVLRLSSLFAAFLFGIIVVRLFRPQAEESFLQLRSRFSVSVAAGLLGSGLLVLCVIVLVFALATMIAGLVVIRSDAAPFGALILIFSLLMVPITSFLSIAGAIIFYSGKIVMGFLIGYLILGRIRQTTHTMSKSGLFLGLVILYGLFAIPYFGFVIYVLISLIGAGAIILGIKHCRRPLLASSENPDLPGDPPPVTPPPPLPPASGVA